MILLFFGGRGNFNHRTAREVPGSHSFSAFQQEEKRASTSKVQFENSQGRTLTGPPGLHLHSFYQSLLPPGLRIHSMSQSMSLGGRGKSWYVGSSIDHKPNFMSGTSSYRRIFREILGKHAYDCNQLPTSTMMCLIRKPS